MKPIILVAVLAALPACVEPPEVGPPLAGECDPDDSDPDVDVSFGRDIRPLFARSREEGAGCGCHDRAAGAAGFSVGSLAALMNGGMSSGVDIVVPGDPCSSILVQKLSPAPPFGARMPNNGPPFFTDAERQLIHDWIAEGAFDN